MSAVMHFSRVVIVDVGHVLDLFVSCLVCDRHLLVPVLRCSPSGLVNCWGFLLIVVTCAATVAAPCSSLLGGARTARAARARTEPLATAPLQPAPRSARMRALPARHALALLAGERIAQANAENCAAARMKGTDLQSVTLRRWT